jgi:hypothetical protein
MKEVIMKKLLFWMVLIVGTVALLGSCAKKEESTTAAAAGNVAGTGTTASGTLTGTNVTGTFHSSWGGATPAGGCISNSSAISQYELASDTKSFKEKWIVTGTSTYTSSTISYSDATCSTMTSYISTMYENVTTGSEVTGLTAGSSPTLPTTASKISSVEDQYVFMANTTVSIAHFLSDYEQTVVSGTEKVVNESSPVTKYGLGTTSTVSGNLWLFINSKISTADNVTDWAGAGVYYQ